MWRLTEEDDACLLSLCQGIVDVSFKQPRRHSAPGKVCEYIGGTGEERREWERTREDIVKRITNVYT